MKQILLVLSFILIFDLAQANEKNSLEAEVCINCLDEAIRPENLKLDLKEVSKAANQCEQKSFFVDPKKKSLFELDPADPRSAKWWVKEPTKALACLYGLGNGVVNNLVDLVMLVPELCKMFWNAQKWAVSKAMSGSWVPKSNPFTWEKIKNASQKAYDTSVSVAQKTIQGASDLISQGYEQGGAGGAISAIGLEIYESSPHRVVKNMMASAITEVANFASKEWKTFNCLSEVAQEEFICKLTGYVLVDVLTGKLIYGNLAKAPKLVEGLGKMKDFLKSRAALSKEVLKDFEKVHPSEILQKAEWKVDGRWAEKGQDVEIAEVNGKLYARGIDPDSGQISYYAVKEQSAEKTLEKMAQTERRADQSPQLLLDEPSSASSATFDFVSREIVQSEAEFVSRVSKATGVKIDAKNAQVIGQAFKKSPEYGKQYGSLMKAVDDLKIATDSKAKATLARARADNLVEESQDILSEANSLMARFGDEQQLNLHYLRRSIEKSVDAENISDLKIVKETLRDLSTSIDKKGSVKEGVDAWAQSLKKKNPNLSDDEIKSIHQCFLTGAVR